MEKYGILWEERGFPSTWISARMAADMQTMESIISIREEFDGSLENRVIVVAGITYKENVDDTRLSHGREIIQHIKQECEEIRIWDPMSAEDELFGIPVSRDASVLEGSDCLLITVPHTDFVNWAENPEECSRMRTKLIFDGWGIFSGRDAYEKNRWIAGNLMTAFETAKQNSLKRLADFNVSRIPIPWIQDSLASIDEELFHGSDYWPYGIDSNRVTLETFLQYCDEQGVTQKKLQLEDLFVPEVASSFKI